MSPPEPRTTSGRARREPPRFRGVVVRRAERLSPHLVRVTLGGPDLAGFAVEQPAASVRLLLPARGSRDVVVPAWEGNEFLLPDGRRPTIRTLTPRRFDPDTLELDVDVVIHDGGRASGWADAARPGDAAAISGPGRGYDIDRDAPAFLLAGDETAIPAISQLLEALPGDTPVHVLVEVAHPDARLDLPTHPRVSVAWCDLPGCASPGDALVEAIQAVEIAPGARVWAAGEAAAVQRIRRFLFDERAVPRAQTVIRGYWKHGRTGDTDDA